jgi:hypothetical protein
MRGADDIAQTTTVGSRRKKLKKGVSPVVTVVVILVVVVIVVLLWMRFSTPPAEPGATGGGMGINIDPSRLTPEAAAKAQADAKKANKEFQDLSSGSRGTSREGETQ